MKMNRFIALICITTFLLAGCAGGGEVKVTISNLTNVDLDVQIEAPDETVFIAILAGEDSYYLGPAGWYTVTATYYCGASWVYDPGPINVLRGAEFIITGEVYDATEIPADE